MRSIHMRVKTGADSVLHLSIPVEIPDQEYEVIVYVHPRLTEWPPGYEELFGRLRTRHSFALPSASTKAYWFLMAYLLDTNVLYRIPSRAKRAASVSAFMRVRVPTFVSVSVVKAELDRRYSAQPSSFDRSRQGGRLCAAYLSMPFDDAAAEVFATHSVPPGIPRHDHRPLRPSDRCHCPR